MRILAIDPGPEQSAWVIYDSDAHALLDFHIDDNADLSSRIHMKGSPCDPSCRSFRVVPSHIAVEMIASYGMAVSKSIFDTCVWIGRFIEEWGARKYERQADARGIDRWIDLGNGSLLFRKEIVKHLCGSSHAKDSNVRQAVLDRFPASGGGKTPQVGTKDQPGPLYGVSKDLWSAIAVALCYADQFCKVEAVRE